MVVFSFVYLPSASICISLYLFIYSLEANLSTFLHLQSQVYFCVGGSGCLLFLRLLKLTNFTCSSSNSVDLIKSCIFIFIELKVKGVGGEGLLFFCLFVCLFFNLKSAKNSDSQKSSMLNRPW